MNSYKILLCCHLSRKNNKHPHIFAISSHLSVYHKFKCSCTITLKAQTIASGPSDVFFISAVTLTCDKSINYKVDHVVLACLQTITGLESNLYLFSFFLVLLTIQSTK